MNTDFLDAHLRHWDDAELLKSAARLANADQLYGLSAECGLKRLMIHFGMPMHHSGSPSETQDKRHADQIWDRYESYRSGAQHTGYALPPSNPFSNWSIHQRYASRADFNEARVMGHRQGAETVKQLVSTARRDGLI